MSLELILLGVICQFVVVLSQSNEPQCLTRAEIEAIFGDKLMSDSDVQRGFQSVVAHSVRLQETLKVYIEAEVQSQLGALRSELTEEMRREQESILSKVESLVPPPGSYGNPSPSCDDILQVSPTIKYWIKANSTADGVGKVFKHCVSGMLMNSCCDGKGRWIEVAHLDMTNPDEQCPSGFRQVTSPKRMCGRPTTGCVSTTYPVHGVQYSRVCGMIKAYQFGDIEAFNSGSKVIDRIYVDGVSLTYGQSPRNHIWTFAVNNHKEYSESSRCPCSVNDIVGSAVPSFVGRDFFCDSGASSSPSITYYTGDPLWDGQGCGNTATSKCCSFNNPPWFCKELPEPTTEDIELRICSDADPTSNEDTLIEVVSINVQ